MNMFVFISHYFDCFLSFVVTNHRAASIRLNWPTGKSL